MDLYGKLIETIGRRKLKSSFAEHVFENCKKARLMEEPKGFVGG